MASVRPGVGYCAGASGWSQPAPGTDDERPEGETLRVRHAQLMCICLYVGVLAVAGCGSGADKGAPGAPAADTASTSTSTSAPRARSVDVTKVAYSDAVLTAADIQATLQFPMDRTSSKALTNSGSKIRALCGGASPGSTAAAGWFEQFDTIPAGRVLVVEAIQGWQPGALDAVWDSETTIASSCGAFTSSGYPYTTVAKSASPDRISVLAEDLDTAVYVSDDLARIGDVVVSVRMSWDAHATSAVDRSTHQALLEDAVSRAQSILKGD
jgi:hypothetical protein